MKPRKFSHHHRTTDVRPSIQTLGEGGGEGRARLPGGAEELHLFLAGFLLRMKTYFFPFKN